MSSFTGSVDRFPEFLRGETLEELGQAARLWLWVKVTDSGSGWRVTAIKCQQIRDECERRSRLDIYEQAEAKMIEDAKRRGMYNPGS